MYSLILVYIDRNSACNCAGRPMGTNVNRLRGFGLFDYGLICVDKY